MTTGELQSTPRLQEIFPNPPMIAFKKNRSLSNILVRAKISLNQHLYIPLQQVDERLSQPTAELKLQQLETLYGLKG